MTLGEIADILRGRDVVFNVFSHVFVDVPDEGSDTLLAETMTLLAEVVATTDNVDMREGFAHLTALLSEKNNATNISDYLKETRLDRSRAYTTLFILQQGADSVYESAHRSPERLLKQEPWSAVKEFYQRNGFCHADLKNISEDHISLELQFMGLLSGKAADACEHEDTDACEETLKAQLCFYEEHISQWIPSFCEKIAEAKDIPGHMFYAAYALLLKGFIAEDMLLLKDILEE